MKEILYFPKLGLMFNISPILLSFGPFTVYWYGVLIAIGFLLSISYATYVAPKFYLNIKDIETIIFLSIVSGIIGARLYYVIFNFNIYKYNLANIFKIWEGGLAIYGGIFGAFFIGILLCKKQNVPVLNFMDLASNSLLLGQSIGRWGNFFNIEAYGKNTDNIFGMISISIKNYLTYIQPKLAKEGIIINPNHNVHPCFFYESVWCLLGFLLLTIIFFNSNYIGDKEHIRMLHNKKIILFPGVLSLIYFAWYSLGRFFIEKLRVDSLMVGNIKVSRFLSLILFYVSILGLFVIYKFNMRNYLEKIKNK